MRNALFTPLKYLGGLKAFNLYKKWFGFTAVICLHRINNEPNIFFPALKTEVFEGLIKYISKNFSVVGLEDVYGLSRTGKPKIVITFDDGYKDFITNALPVLKKYQVPSVHGIVYNCAEMNGQIWTQRYFNLFQALLKSGQNKLTIKLSIGDFSFLNTEKEILKISKYIFSKLLFMDYKKREVIIEELVKQLNVLPQEEKMMNWDDIIESSHHRVEIASHTMSHDVLNDAIDEKDLLKEVSDSRIMIGQKVGKEVRTLAFPNGIYSTKVVNLAEQAGYSFLLGLDDRLAKCEMPVMSRVSIYHDDLLENQFKVEGFHNIIKKPYRNVIKRLIS